MNIGAYEIGQVFHIGSSGPLWKTRTDAGDALVALRSPNEGERCLARWKSWASITSRHVVALRDVVRSDDGRWAIVQDYVPGRSLDAELGSPDLRPIATRRQILHGIAAGVSALHGAGIAHGDLTPANVIITPEGRAVIIDLIDEIGDGEGTPGWSLEATGREADRRCLRQIASLLDMNEELTTLGFDESSTSGSAVTPTVCEPDEHVITREPVDPGRVIAELRAAALREDTLTDAAVRAHDTAFPSVARRRSTWRVGRSWRVGVLAVGVVAIAVGLSIMVYGVWGSGNEDGAEASPRSHETASSAGTSTSSSMCEPAALAETISHAIVTRDRAVMDGDASVLGSVLGGELLAQDTQRIEAMLSEGVRVPMLSSRIDNVAVISCEQGAIDVGATLIVESSQTCRADGCDTHDTPTATELLIRVDPVSGKVVKAEPAQPGGQQSGS